jgi:hypothetical protein
MSDRSAQPIMTMAALEAIMTNRKRKGPSQSSRLGRTTIAKASHLAA